MTSTSRVAPAERARRAASMEKLGEIRGVAVPMRETTPDTPEGNAVALAQALLVWARRERIALGQVTIGPVSLVIHDLGIAPLGGPGLNRELSARGRDLREEYGGDVLRKFREQHADTEPVYEDDEDDEPEPTPRRKRGR